MDQFDTEGLHQFLMETPEKGLRKMLVDGQYTEMHFNILMKVVRGCDKQQFSKHFEAGDFPKMRFNDKEAKIKETFWKASQSCFLQRGILSTVKKVVIAA